MIDDPRSERSETGRLRRLIESHVLADRSREGVLLNDLEVLCQAMGLKTLVGSERVDRLAELVDNPWIRASVPYAGKIQLIRLGGRGSKVLTDGSVELDLNASVAGVDGPDSVGDA